ncbi:hypothetical protein HDU87_008709 [Geranomyces variabilis]|uniref:Amidohydrolase-related domain-containing protein n=1 Tax=Geranomyces variabilis TaxID=109894 RepID=A0AAD5TCK9_9FUNG|nr:hypothetical protein HDU87_008709 [Geranomyces variabilis]
MLGLDKKPGNSAPAGSASRNAWTFSAAAILSAVLAINSLTYFHTPPASPAGGISAAAFSAGWNLCQGSSLHTSQPVDKDHAKQPSGSNPRDGIGGLPKHRAVVLRNATLLNGDGSISRAADIYMRGGVFSDPPSAAEFAKEDWIEVQVDGRYVTPGLVDQHSHAGVDSWPALWASDDTNEMTESPTMPQLRALDGFDPSDPAIAAINSGGVTSFLGLPGSGNLMGGEGYTYKSRRLPSNEVADMRMEAGDTSRTLRYMKMACGENPKRVYGSRHLLPGSRLGSAWGFRKQFAAARSHMHAQDDWCAAAGDAKQRYGHDDGARKALGGRFPEDLALESLVALLRGKVLLNVHCYETHDLEMMVRMSHEFGFKIQSFHHALEAWKVPALLARENISVALFADHWGYKKEAYGTSTRAGEILRAAGVDVAYKSDHPVLNSQHLIFEAAKAHHYGLDAADAIASVTTVPAKKLGLADRIGWIGRGYDADAVIWNAHPLTLGAHPVGVYVDGYQTSGKPLGKQTRAAAAIMKEFVPAELAMPAGQTTCPARSALYTVTNIRRLHANEDGPIENASIVVDRGIVSCVGKCEARGNIFDAGGGVATPGLIASLSQLGIGEISSEPSTRDGAAKDHAALYKDAGTRAADALRPSRDSKMLRAAVRAGVLRAEAVPANTGFVQGYGAVFRTGADDYTTADVRPSGLHVAIGDAARDDTLASSVSGQIAKLRQALRGSPETSAGWEPVLGGRKAAALVVHVNEANDIHRVLDLLDPLYNSRGVKLTIAGGAEAHLVADRLEALQALNVSVSVILNPARCMPSTWESRRCILPGQGGASRVGILRDAGVHVALAVAEAGETRDLMWEAGWALADAREHHEVVVVNQHPQQAPPSGRRAAAPDEADAVGWVTWNVADALGVKDVGRILVGQPANFVLYDGSPVDLRTHLLMVADRDGMGCHPRQE